jgi:hypothetical protein
MTVDEPQWRSEGLQAASIFAGECRDANGNNPGEPVVDFFINTLITELWDNGFSQSEIRKAFEEAIGDMPRYCAGEERKGG